MLTQLIWLRQHTLSEPSWGAIAAIRCALLTRALCNLVGGPVQVKLLITRRNNRRSWQEVSFLSIPWTVSSFRILSTVTPQWVAFVCAHISISRWLLDRSILDSKQLQKLVRIKKKNRMIGPTGWSDKMATTSRFCIGFFPLLLVLLVHQASALSKHIPISL